MKQVSLYLSRQASSIRRYVWEQIVQAAVGWIPGIIGIGVRAIVYRTMMHMDGVAAIEDGVRIRFADNVRLGRGVYLDHGVYLHACPGGISIGPDSYVMKNAILHVYNFRNLPHAGIRIGARSLIGEACILRGQGGITIGNDVFLAPLVQMLAVNHVYHDTSRPISLQGITCQGIIVEDGAWIGGGAIILDGVRIGKNAVVGAGAVVTRDVPDYCVAVGNPARIVRDLRSQPAAPVKVPVY
ncbi:MAG: acyltransferase [Roseiflexus sp.]|nr:acyltransferase [Roseiflexus sp.]MCS7288464.1 acyltransferase [Roseiflexus sp.]MDW8145836.1 acyltransferase [Roseiflexaceae bacterium]MDW8233285.1 acyltransferase [Roseiflexaceae bacterium]